MKIHQKALLTLRWCCLYEAFICKILKCWTLQLWSLSVLYSFLISHPRLQGHSHLQLCTIQIFRGKIYLALCSYKHFIYLFVFLLKLMICWSIHMFGRRHKQSACDVVSRGNDSVLGCGCCHNLGSPLTGCRLQAQIIVWKPLYVLNRSFIGSIEFREARNDAPWLTTRCQAKLKLGFLPVVVCLHVWQMSCCHSVFPSSINHTVL